MQYSALHCTALHQPELYLSIPADNFRPYITSFQGNNCTDYINAVFVDVSIGPLLSYVMAVTDVYI